MADSVKVVAKNSKAYHDYFIEEKYEAGIELAGTEVKSIRAGQVNLKDSFCTIKDGELFVRGMHISPYEHGNIFNKDPVRPRRLLMHKREIARLFGKVKQDGYALVPISVSPLLNVMLLNSAFINASLPITLSVEGNTILPRFLVPLNIPAGISVIPSGNANATPSGTVKLANA